MHIHDLDKKEPIQYLSFEEYAIRTKIRYNEKLFVEEEMYFCKIWKSHRQNYKILCEHNNWANDISKLNERLNAYESKINDKFRY